jgi:hypothetical protein
MQAVVEECVALAIKLGDAAAYLKRPSVAKQEERRETGLTVYQLRKRHPSRRFVMHPTELDIMVNI